MHRERHLWGEYVLDIRRAVEAHMHRGVRCHQKLLVLYVGARGPDGFFTWVTFSLRHLYMCNSSQTRSLTCVLDCTLSCGEGI